MDAGQDTIFERAEVHAIQALPFPERQTTNLHIDKRVIPAGETVGPKHLRIVTKQASVLVFADTKPMANFGHDCRYLFYSATLAFNPDGDHDGIVEAEEAFAYANAVKDPNDTPNFSESSEAGGDISLGHQYVLWGWWCAILRRELEQYYVNLPIPEYYELLRTAQPDLLKLSQEIDGRSAELRSEYEPRLKAAIEEAFGGR